MCDYIAPHHLLTQRYISQIVNKQKKKTDLHKLSNKIHKIQVFVPSPCAYIQIYRSDCERPPAL